jgi:hypothetical protein
MSSRLIACVLALFTAAAASGVDWGAFAAASDPSLDPALLDAMAHGDQETRMAICTGITLRKDPAIGVFIETLAAERPGAHDWRIEHCLRLILAGLIDQGRSLENRRVRADANAAALDLLFTRAVEWQDPQLLGLLMQAVLLHPSSEGLKAVMDVGRRLTDALELNGGLLPPQETALAREYLATAKSLARGDFLPQCAAIARLSRDGILVEAARLAAGTLADRSSPRVDSPPRF